MLWIGNGTDKGIGSKITNITSNTTRGNYTIVVSSASGISAGQMVIIKMNDSSDRSLLYHIHNNQIHYHLLKSKYALILTYVYL